jgi:transcriptional regulator with XRE-family HTH domain
MAMTVHTLPRRPEPASLQEVITRVVRFLMTDFGRTQANVATALGVSQPQVSQRLLGKTAWSIEDLDRLSAYFGVTVAELVGGRPMIGDPGGGERARRDSNPQPSDPKAAPAERSHLVPLRAVA